ncbi:MAG: general secretion pathway protein GspK [Planctomycetes bacterium]|nr:general secretion pathway protein GspK [Planctomycetota bacterium]
MQVPIFLNRGGALCIAASASAQVTVPVRVRVVSDEAGRIRISGLVIVEYAGDLDGDGRKDLLVTEGTSTLAVHRGAAGFVFREEVGMRIPRPGLLRLRLGEERGPRSRWGSPVGYHAPLPGRRPTARSPLSPPQPAGTGIGGAAAASDPVRALPPMVMAPPHAPRPSERGIALILVLIILPLVAIIMTQLDFEVTIGEHLANNLLATQQFKFAIRARAQQMRQRLVRDLTEDEKSGQQQGAYDHASDLWGPDSEGGGTSLTVSRGDKEADDAITLYTQIIDEQGKFNLNLLRHSDATRRGRAQEVLVRLLDFYRDARFGDFEESSWDLSEPEAKEVAESVVRFLRGEERDERVRASELPAPTPDTKQGALTVDDLVFSHRLFLEKRLNERFTDIGSGQSIPALAEFLTLHGSTAVNANTAPVQVLRALFREDVGQRNIAEEIYVGRGGYLNTTEDQERARKTSRSGGRPRSRDLNRRRRRRAATPTAPRTT